LKENKEDGRGTMQEAMQQRRSSEHDTSGIDDLSVLISKIMMMTQTT
jgi:hypothetical protein